MYSDKFLIMFTFYIVNQPENFVSLHIYEFLFNKSYYIVLKLGDYLHKGKQNVELYYNKKVKYHK